MKEAAPIVMAASGSLDLVDLHGVGRPGGLAQGPVKAAIASATTQYHWPDPCHSTKSSRCEKPSACFSALGVADSSLEPD